MLDRVRLHFIAWLLERYPQAYFRWKKIGKHRLCTDRDFLALHAQSLRDGEGLQVLEERYNLWVLTRSVARLPGVLAEVGVYRGGSARLIAAAKGGAQPKVSVPSTRSNNGTSASWHNPDTTRAAASAPAFCPTRRQRR